MLLADFISLDLIAPAMLGEKQKFAPQRFLFSNSQ
jgi:hypothetical protein